MQRRGAPGQPGGLPGLQRGSQYRRAELLRRPQRQRVGGQPPGGEAVALPRRRLPGVLRGQPDLQQVPHRPQFGLTSSPELLRLRREQHAALFGVGELGVDRHRPVHRAAADRVRPEADPDLPAPGTALT